MTDSEHDTTTTALEDAALLIQLRADFPAFRIWREITGDRIVYVARRRHPSIRLHTLVTRDPHELHAVLASSSPTPAASPTAPAAARNADSTRVSDRETSCT